MAGTVSAPRAESRQVTGCRDERGHGCARTLSALRVQRASRLVAGSYALTVEARGCGKTRRRSTTIALA
jgi:hypothetical protein